MKQFTTINFAKIVASSWSRALICCLIFGCFVCHLIAADHFFVIEPTAFTLPSGDTRIVWRTAIVARSGKVLISPTGQKSFELPEVYDQMRLHSVTIPANRLPLGATATARIVHPVGEREITSAPFTFVVSHPTFKGKVTPFRVELQVPESGIPRENWYVKSGVPFKQGVLADATQVRLVNSKGETCPAAFEVFSRWRDGSVKWLTCHFAATTTATPVKYYLVDSTENPQPPISRANPELLRRLRGELVLQDGRKFTAAWKNSHSHSFRVTTAVYDAITVDGVFDGDPRFHWRVTGVWLPNGMIKIKWRILRDSPEFSLNIRSFTWRGLPSLGGASRQIRQWRQDEGETLIDGKSTTIRHARGFIRGDKRAIFVRDFWQTFPKGLRSDAEETVVEVLPPLPDRYVTDDIDVKSLIRDYYWYNAGGYDFRSHMTLAGEFTLVEGDLIASDDEVLFAHLDQPLFAQASPQYYCETGAFGAISPAQPDGMLRSLEALTELNFARFLNRRASNHEYGWMNFGDWFGENRWNWGNNEYDVSNLCALQFARTGRRNYLRRGAEMARHYTTIDHYRNFIGHLPEGTMYPHLIGHIGTRYRRDDPRLQAAKIPRDCFGAWRDTYGGHDFQVGNFLIASLLGDRDIFDTACRATESLAREMTRECPFNIEREAGWFLQNQVCAYENTCDPLFLEAARCYVEKVARQQNPFTGCMDLPADPNECDCPDKLVHVGGKPFSAAVLAHGLIRYYEATGDETARRTITRLADWLITRAYDPKTHKMYYSTACPKFNRVGTWFPGNVLDCLLYASQLTDDIKYTNFAVRHIKYGLPFDYGNCGKEFAQKFGGMPWLLKMLEERKAYYTGFEYETNARRRQRRGEILLEAENFSGEEGGAAQSTFSKEVSCRYLEEWRESGHLLSWNFDVDFSDQYTLFLRCRSTMPAEVRLIVNGECLGKFTIGGGVKNEAGVVAETWNLTPIQHGSESLFLNIRRGQNNITLVKTDDTPISLDYLLLTRHR